MRSNKPILLVEDDEIDVMSVKRSLRDLAVSNRLEVTGAKGHRGDTGKSINQERPPVHV